MGDPLCEPPNTRVSEYEPLMVVEYRTDGKSVAENTMEEVITELFAETESVEGVKRSRPTPLSAAIAFPN